MHQFFNIVFDGSDVQGLADDTGRGHQHVLVGELQLLPYQAAHLLRHLDAVGIAGVGIAAVTDDRLRQTVLQMLLGHRQGCTLHQIGGLDCCRIGGDPAEDQRQILLGFVFLDSAMNACGPKAVGGNNTAFYKFHNNLHSAAKASAQKGI